MRISVWSSDVCSSDLASAVKYPTVYCRIFSHQIWIEGAGKLSDLSAKKLGQSGRAPCLLKATDRHRIWLRQLAERSTEYWSAKLRTACRCQEIGRASLRERVCKYG